MINTAGCILMYTAAGIGWLVYLFDRYNIFDS